MIPGVSRISSTPAEAVEVVAAAAKAGFHGVQIKTNQLRDWEFDYARFAAACGPDAALGRGGVVFHPGTDYATWPEKTAKVLAFAQAAKAEHACYCFCPSPQEPDSLKLALENLQSTGKQYAAAGIPFSLHNHTGSVFGRLEDLRRAAELLDPAICGLTFDTAHAHNCGITDLGAAINALARVITNVHLKDARTDGEFCPIGTGAIDLPAVLAALNGIGYRHWLIVDEESRDYDTPTAYEMSMRFLRTHGAVA